MRTFNFFLVLILFSLCAEKSHAQEGKQEQAADTIHLLSTRKLLVNVKSITFTAVNYVDLKTGETKTTERKQIEKIVFGNGRIEVFNKPVFSMVAEGDWKTVVITEKEDDVVGMHKITEVSATSPASSRSFKQAKRNAEIRIQKLAAKYGGLIVLLTSKENTGGYGEVPSYAISGIVYGYEAPSDEIKKKIEEDRKAQEEKERKKEEAKNKSKKKKKKKR